MPNTALNRTTVALLTNKSGGNLNFGDVVILDNTNANGFTTTTTSGLSSRGIGVILEPNGIASNASGTVAIGGWVPRVNLNTASTIGQFIKSHTVAGQATPHSAPQVAGDFGTVLAASSTPAAMLFGSANPTAPTSSGIVLPEIATGRLTTESGVPLSTSDRSAQGTIYYTPFVGAIVALYDGAAWAYYTLTEVSLALTATSGKNYDVFLYSNAGTLTLELSAAWTNDTTRADAIALQDGVYVKSGTTTRRLVGTIRASGSNVTADVGGGVTTQVGGQRYVWNYQNQVPRSIGVIDTTNSWSYTTATWRQANGASGNKVEWIQGLVGRPIDLRLMQLVNIASNSANAGRSGIGYDTTSGSSGIYGNVYNNGASLMKANCTSFYVATGALGYHFGAWMEYGGAGTMTWIGDDAGPDAQSGIAGLIWC